MSVGVKFDRIFVGSGVVFEGLVTYTFSENDEHAEKSRARTNRIYLCTCIFYLSQLMAKLSGEKRS